MGKEESSLLKLGDEIHYMVDFLGGIVEMRTEAKPVTVIAGFAKRGGDTSFLHGGKEQGRIAARVSGRDDAGA